MVIGVVVNITPFQSYQFMQINPDLFNYKNPKKDSELFQSYQFMQINPDNIGV